MKIGILGCGWLGEPLAKNLINKGYDVYGTTTSDEKIERLSNLGIKTFLFNLENIESNIVGFLNCDLLIISISSKNIVGFQNLIKYLEKAKSKKIIFVSSTSVYEKSNEILTEKSLLKTSPLVDIEKLFTKNINFETTIIRFAGLFGYNRKPGNFHQEGKIIQNPEGYVNMIHQDDCIQIICKIIEKNIWGRIYNACADTHPKRKDFYTKASLVVGKEAPVFDNKVISDKKIVSNEKLKQELNYKFKYPDLLSALEA